MTTIVFDPKVHKFDKTTNTFSVPGKSVRFDSNYEMKNPKTGGTKVFDFKSSTGSEWDPKTIWIYKSEDGMTLNVGNEDVTPAHAQAYVDHKLGKR